MNLLFLNFKTKSNDNKPLLSKSNAIFKVSRQKCISNFFMATFNPSNANKSNEASVSFDTAIKAAILDVFKVKHLKIKTFLTIFKI